MSFLSSYSRLCVISATIQVRKLGVFFQVWALSRVSVFVCLILKQGQRLRPWAAQQLSKLMGAPPPPPPPPPTYPRRGNELGQNQTKLLVIYNQWRTLKNDNENLYLFYPQIWWRKLLSGLKITDSRSPVMMTGQIFFWPDKPGFWPVK